MKYFLSSLLPFLFLCGKSTAQEWVFPNTDSLPQKLVLFFFGDVMQHAPQISSAWNAQTQDYDYKTSFQYMIPYWLAADYVIANLETTLGDDNFSGYPQFCAPWQLARDLQFCGVSILTTGNNHSCDRGAEGIRTTIRALDSLKILHTGTFTDTLSWQACTPLYLRHEGFKVALLNYTYGTNGIPVTGGQVVSMIDSAVMRRDIGKAQRDSATNIVVMIHWGDEYALSPNAAQRGLARWLHSLGADAVVGSHPHVVQPVEYVANEGDTTGVTAFSLGNFVSNQRERYTTGGIGLRLTIAREKGKTTGYRMEYLSSHVYRQIEEGRVRYYVAPEGTAARMPEFGTDGVAGECFRDIDSIIGGAIPKVKE